MDQGGRPSKYNTKYNTQAYKLCLLGATDQELADFFEVNIDTIHEWKHSKKGFSDSVKKGKIIADADVAKSFHKRAVGYAYTEETFEKLGNKEMLEVTSEGDMISVETYKKKIVTKEMPPDPGAALNWLKNRQPDKWRDKKEVGHSGGINITDEPITFR